MVWSLSRPLQFPKRMRARVGIAALVTASMLAAAASPALAEGQGIPSESQFLSSWKEGQPIPPGSP